MEFTTYTLPNGIRGIHRRIKGNVTHCALLVNAGSRDELKNQFGLAHFTEHALFKGTEHRKAYQVNCRLENLGGELNAFTTKEDTTIHATTLRRRHRPVSIRRFITRRPPQTTVPHTLMSQTESWMRYSHICSLWDLFHATGKPGSSALPIKPAPSRKAAISPLHWPDGTGSSSIRHNFHTKKQGRRHF